MAKGIELPVNVLVIIAIAVIILIALVALVTTGIISFKPAEVELAKNSACSQLISRGCGTTSPQEIKVNIDVTGDGFVNDEDTLQKLCEKEFGVKEGDTTACKKVCRCPGI